MATPLRPPTYLAQGIKPTVVHWNELHQVQALMTESLTANRPGWVIWISLLHSWRTTAFNMSLSRLQTWDSCFFIHFRGFILVPMAANNLTFSSMSLTYSTSKLATWSPPGVTSGEVLIDTEPTGDSRVTSTSISCDTSLVFSLSTCWETVDFNAEVLSNMTCWLYTIFLFSGSYNL